MMEIPVVLMNPSRKGKLTMAARRRKKTSILNTIGLAIGVGGIIGAAKFAADGYEFTNMQTAAGTLAAGLGLGLAAIKWRPDVGTAAIGAGVALGGNSLAKALVLREAKAALKGGNGDDDVEGLGAINAYNRRLKFRRQPLGALVDGSRGGMGAVVDGSSQRATSLGALVFDS